MFIERRSDPHNYPHSWANKTEKELKDPFLLIWEINNSLGFDAVVSHRVKSDQKEKKNELFKSGKLIRFSSSKQCRMNRIPWEGKILFLKTRHFSIVLEWNEPQAGPLRGQNNLRVEMSDLAWGPNFGFWLTSEGFFFSLAWKPQLGRRWTDTETQTFGGFQIPHITASEVSLGSKLAVELFHLFVLPCCFEFLEAQKDLHISKVVEVERKTFGWFAVQQISARKSDNRKATAMHALPTDCCFHGFMLEQLEENQLEPCEFILRAMENAWSFCALCPRMERTTLDQQVSFWLLWKTTVAFPHLPHVRKVSSSVFLIVNDWSNAPRSRLHPEHQSHTIGVCKWIQTENSSLFSPQKSRNTWSAQMTQIFPDIQQPPRRSQMSELQQQIDPCQFWFAEDPSPSFSWKDCNSSHSGNLRPLFSWDPWNELSWCVFREMFSTISKHHLWKSRHQSVNFGGFYLICHTPFLFVNFIGGIFFSAHFISQPDWPQLSLFSLRPLIKVQPKQIHTQLKPLNKEKPKQIRTAVLCCLLKIFSRMQASANIPNRANCRLIVLAWSIRSQLIT